MYLIPRPLLLKEKGRNAPHPPGVGLNVPHPPAPSPEGEGEKRNISNIPLA